MIHYKGYRMTNNLCNSVDGDSSKFWKDVTCQKCKNKEERIWAAVAKQARR